MSNTRADQAMETKQKLLDGALALFSEQGYSKTFIRALARKVGLSDGILYHHFPAGKGFVAQRFEMQSAPN